MSRKIQTQAQITGVRALSDRSISLNIHTQEMTDIEKTVLFSFQGKLGWMLFKENEIQEEEIPKGDADLESKTPSQRQRGIIWRIWERQGKQGDYNDFYIRMMDKIAEGLKVKYLE